MLITIVLELNVIFLADSDHLIWEQLHYKGYKCLNVNCFFMISKCNFSDTKSYLILDSVVILR